MTVPQSGRTMGYLVIVLAALAFASGLSAQSTCSIDGLVLHGQPSERVFTGPDGAEVQALTQEESLEFELVVTCENGYLIHASRQGRQLRYYPSGCYNILSNVSGQIHTRAPFCDEIFGETKFDYSEVIRNGIYQIIYRGRLIRSRLGDPQ